MNLLLLLVLLTRFSSFYVAFSNINSNTILISQFLAQSFVTIFFRIFRKRLYAFYLLCLLSFSHPFLMATNWIAFNDHQNCKIQCMKYELKIRKNSWWNSRKNKTHFYLTGFLHNHVYTHVNSCQKGLERLLACVKSDVRWHLCLHLMIISKTCLEFPN